MQDCTDPEIPVTLKAFGDSITYGSLATDDEHKWVNIVAETKEWDLTNLGSGGARIGDGIITDAIYATITGNKKNYTLLTGTNDMRIVTTNKDYQDAYRLNLQAVSAWLAIPDNYKIRAKDVIAAGTWSTNPSTLFSGMGRQSTTNGSALTFQVKGSSVYVGFIRLYPGGAGEFSVTVDGVLKGKYTTTGLVPARSGDGSTYGAALVRIPNLPNRKHTVVITVTSPTNASNQVYIDWVAGNGFKYDTCGPNVYVGNCISGNAAGYTSFGGSDQAVGEFNNHILDAVTELAEDGLRVVHVDAANSLDYDTDLAAEGLHPNNLGHAAIAKAFLRAMGESYITVQHRANLQRKNTSWYPVTFLGVWVNYGGSEFNDAHYMKDTSGVVRMKGLIKSGSVGGTAFVLPSGFRPTRIAIFTVATASGYGNVYIYPDGRVSPNIGNNGYFSLDGINFLAEA